MKHLTESQVSAIVGTDKLLLRKARSSNSRNVPVEGFRGGFVSLD